MYNPVELTALRALYSHLKTKRALLESSKSFELFNEIWEDRVTQAKQWLQKNGLEEDLTEAVNLWPLFEKIAELDPGIKPPFPFENYDSYSVDKKVFGNQKAPLILSLLFDLGILRVVQILEKNDDFIWTNNKESLGKRSIARIGITDKKESRIHWAEIIDILTFYIVIAQNKEYSGIEYAVNHLTEYESAYERFNS